MDSKLVALLSELRRRTVWRVAGVYGTTALATALAVAELYDDVGLPEGSPRAVIVALLVGFPIAVVLAWIHDLRREEPTPSGIAEAVDSLGSNPGDDEHSIAVLPFVNLGADPESEYFADGMTEEIINAVANVAGLRVIARTSAFAFKGASQDVREIGERLGVATLLEGSVRRSGDRLRITAQLINASGGHHLWSERYDRDITDVFEIQDEIAQIIAAKLMPGVSTETRVRGGTEDLLAYEAYLRGVFTYWQQYSIEGSARALTHFEEATERDPGFALAHAGASICHTWLAGFGHGTGKSTPEQARASAKKALELDPTLAEGLVSLAEALFYLDWDFAGAEQALLQAIRVSPSNAHAHSLYAYCLRRKGLYDEAIAEYETAIALDPLSVSMHSELANTYLAAGRDEEAKDQVSRALALDDGFVPALETLGWLSVRAGRLDEALAAFKRLPRGRSSTMAALGFTLAMLGRSDEARQFLASLKAVSRDRAVGDDVDIARVYAGLGAFDDAYHHLKRAVENRAIPAILFATSVRDWGEFRNDPRFQALAASDRPGGHGDAAVI